VYLAIVAALGFLFLRLPTSYLPDEDQGILLVQAMLHRQRDPGADQEVLNDIQRYFLEKKKTAVESCLTVAGIGFSGRARTWAWSFVKLKDWKLRGRPDLR
jgi:multidrug efflux pump subunit AcrB